MNSVPVFEWTFNIGTLLVIVFSAGGFYWVTRNDLKSIREDLRVLNKAVSEIAVQNARLDNQGSMLAATQKAQAVLEQRIYDLSQGRGWVQQRLDGEWPQRNPTKTIPQE